MASARLQPPRVDPLSGDERGFPQGPFDDDGIHIASVTRVEDPEGPVLQVVVQWREGGRWVMRLIEMPDETVPPATGR